MKSQETERIELFKHKSIIFMLAETDLFEIIEGFWMTTRDIKPTFHVCRFLKLFKIVWFKYYKLSFTSMVAL